MPCLPCLYLCRASYGETFSLEPNKGIAIALLQLRPRYTEACPAISLAEATFLFAQTACSRVVWFRAYSFAAIARAAATTGKWLRTSAAADAPPRQLRALIKCTTPLFLVEAKRDSRSRIPPLQQRPRAGPGTACQLLWLDEITR